MVTVFKFPIAVQGQLFKLQMPARAEMLDVQVQHGVPVLWAKVDTDQPAKNYAFALVGTGHEIPQEVAAAPHIGSVQMFNGDLVLHLFGGVYS